MDSPRPRRRAPSSSTPTARCSTSTASASLAERLFPAPASASRPLARQADRVHAAHLDERPAAQLSRLHARRPALRGAPPRPRARRRRRDRADEPLRAASPFPREPRRARRAAPARHSRRHPQQRRPRHARGGRRATPASPACSTRCSASRAPAASRPTRRPTRSARAALGLPARDVLFVSSNCWDAIGATWFGYTTLWINRFGLPLDELGARPTRTGTSLADVLDFLRLPKDPRHDARSTCPPACRSTRRSCPASRPS